MDTSKKMYICIFLVSNHKFLNLKKYNNKLITVIKKVNERGKEKTNQDPRYVVEVN